MTSRTLGWLKVSMLAGLTLLPLEALAVGTPLVSTEVLAVVGRPLTPVSYAGVARRTTRRAVAATAAVATTAAVVSVATLPAGCARMNVNGASYYQCGTAYYRPQYDGPNVVYVQSSPPPR
jgi:hypothetical protein